MNKWASCISTCHHVCFPPRFGQHIDPSSFVSDFPTIRPRVFLNIFLNDFKIGRAITSTIRWVVNPAELFYFMKSPESLGPASLPEPQPSTHRGTLGPCPRGGLAPARGGGWMAPPLQESHAANPFFLHSAGGSLQELFSLARLLSSISMSQ